MKNRIKLLVPAVLILAVMLFLMMPFGSAAANADYSKPGATEKITLNSADILERILRVDDPTFTLTPGERAYLAEFGAETVSYSAEIPYLDNVLTAYDEEDGILSVTAFEYSYTTSNGISMLWKPRSVLVGQIEVPLAKNGEEYTATVTGPFDAGTESARVLYTTTLPAFNTRVINSLINKAYEDVVIWDEYEAYLGRLNEYKTALNAYNAYLAELDAYEQRYSEYSIYLGKLSVYEAELAIYERYEEDVKVYNEKYALYMQYLDDVAAYEKNTVLYNKYVENSLKVKSQLAIIEGLMKTTVVKDENTGALMYRQLYGAITGPTVSEVLENKSLITGDKTGIDESEVDIASVATENLRTLFDNYFSYTTEEEKYTYYAMNYKAFETNLAVLLRQLDLFYNNGKIRAGLGQQGLKQKYEILLAQLFYTVNAISDTPVLNYNGKTYTSSYTFNGKTPLSILGGEAYMKDENNATPVEGGYPTPVEEPVPVEEVAEPQKPTVVKPPIAPEVVEHPGEQPAKVDRPSPIANMDPPAEFNLEDPHVLPESVIALVSEYREGKITERAKKTSSVRIEVGVYSTKKFKNTDEVVIRFFDEAGNQLTTAFSVERGSYVEYDGAAPEKSEDDYATYTFIGWKDGPGDDAKQVNMSAVDGDGAELDLYPLFLATKKLYKVTWNDGGSLTYTYEPLDQIPTAPFEPAPFVDEANPLGFETMRVFDGWVDTEGNHYLGGVTKFEEENVYYTSYRFVPFVTATDKDGVESALRVLLDNGTYFINCTSSAAGVPDLSALISFIAGKGGLKIKATGFEIAFSKADVLTLRDEGVSSFRLDENHSDMLDSFAVRLLCGEGISGASVPADIILPWSFSDPDNMDLYYMKDGVRTSVNRTVFEGEDGAALSVRIRTGTEYFAVTEYTVDLLHVENITVEVNKNVLCAGEEFVICYAVPAGKKISSIYMILEGGESIELEVNEHGSVTVVMPACHVSVGIKVESIIYTVTFISDDTVVSRKEYTYGEMPTVPSGLQKATDGEFNYEFIGWDKEVCSVDSDAVYIAMYDKTPVPPKEEKWGLKLSPRVWELLHRAVRLAVPVVFVGFILLPVSIISLIITFSSLSKKRRKKR